MPEDDGKEAVDEPDIVESEPGPQSTPTTKASRRSSKTPSKVDEALLKFLSRPRMSEELAMKVNK